MRTGSSWLACLGVLAAAAAVAAATPAAPPISSPGSHVYLVATSAHSPGAAGSNWVTDLTLHNPGTAAATANVYFLERGLDNTSVTGTSHAVPANGSTRLADVVLATFGKSRASGALLVGSDTPLVVTSRTFNNASAGTFGQYVEGYPALDAVTADEPVRLLQLTKNAVYRTNIGCANASGGSLVVRADLFRADGSAVGTRTLTVPPFGYAQDDDSFAKAGATTVDDGFAVVVSTTPGARFFTYASVIDSRTNDPICVVPVGRAAPDSQVRATPERHDTPATSNRPTTTAAGSCRTDSLAAPLSSVMVTHLAGTLGGPGSSDGTGTSARFAFPSGIVVDAGGTMTIADTANHTLRRLTPTGVSSTLAGLAGHSGTDNGSGTAARFSSPGGVARDGAGNLYVADTGNHTIRKVTPAGVVTTLAGQPGTTGSGDGSGAAARFHSPAALAFDPLSGTLVVADTGNHTVRRVTLAGAVATLAGKAGSAGSVDGVGGAARFHGPAGIAVDSLGGTWVADTGNHTVRKVSQGGAVTTVAGLAGAPGTADGFGTSARFSRPAGLTSDGQGGVWLVEAAGCTLRRVSSAGQVGTLAGAAGQPGTSDGTGAAARFTAPAAVASTLLATLLVADTGNHAIRQVTLAGAVTTLAGMAPAAGTADGVGTTARFDGPADVAVDGFGVAFVADQWNHTVRRITASGAVSTLAGRAGEPGSADGSGGSARFRKPSGLAVDSTGVVFVADRDNHTIRKVSPAGLVLTVAGKAGQPGSSDGTGSAARFASPEALAVTSGGSLVVADTGNCTLRAVTPAGVVTTLAGKAESCGSTDGTGADARFARPSGVAVDATGTVFVADTDNHVIRQVTPAGVVTTLAGKAGAPGATDGTGPNARFLSPSGLALGPGGVLWVTEAQGTVRRIGSDGTVTTVAGLAGSYGSRDGAGDVARFNVPLGVAVAGSDALVVADYDNNAVRVITVAGCELACTATAAPTSGRAPLAVQLTGSVSPFGCACGTPAWVWDFGDGTPPGTVATPLHTYARAGTFTWTATVRAGSVTCSRTGTVTVSPACEAPAAPVLTAPALATTGIAYVLSWTATSPDDTYELQESTDASFADAQSRAVEGTSGSTSHEVGVPTPWFSRVRATCSCDNQSPTSPWSPVATTSVVPGPPPGEPVYLPAAAHVPGLAGTVWVTDLEVHNPGATVAAFTVDLLKTSQDNSTPRTAAFTLPAGTSRRLADALWGADAGFAFASSATLRITATAGRVMATQRTYNSQPAGTFGQFIPGLPARQAVPAGQEARLVGLPHSADPTSGFRTNVGLANASAVEITVTLELFRGDGFRLGSQTRTLPPFGFIQISNPFLAVSTAGVTDGFIRLGTSTEGGAFFAYASVVDNRSGDPIYVPARVVGAR